MLITELGTILRTEVGGINRYRRASRGVTVMKPAGRRSDRVDHRRSSTTGRPRSSSRRSSIRGMVSTGVIDSGQGWFTGHRALDATPDAVSSSPIATATMRRTRGTWRPDPCDACRTRDGRPRGGDLARRHIDRLSPRYDRERVRPPPSRSVRRRRVGRPDAGPRRLPRYEIRVGDEVVTAVIGFEDSQRFLCIRDGHATTWDQEALALAAVISEDEEPASPSASRWTG